MTDLPLEEGAFQADAERLLRKQTEASVLDPAGPSALATDSSVAEDNELIEEQEAT